MRIRGQDSVYSWFIAVVCCGLTFLTLGLLKLDGFLFVESMLYFEENRKGASTSIFIFQVTRAIAGLVGGYLGQTFGLRTVLVLGSATFSLGLSSCFFAKDILALYILWGGIGGLGSGLIISMISQVVNVFFKRHFAKAIGLTFAGGPVGGMIFSAVITSLFDKYGLLGTFLILGGIVMHGIPLALMVNTSVIHRKPRYKVKESQKQQAYPLVTEPEIEAQNFTKELAYEHQTLKPKNDSNLSTEYDTVVDFIPKNNHNTNSMHASNKPRVVDGANEDLTCQKLKTLDEHNILHKDPPTLSIQNKEEFKSSLTKLKKSESSIRSFNIFLNITYHIIAFSTAFFIVIFNTVLVDVCLDKGFNINESTYIVIIFNVSDLLSRLMLGWITDGEYLTRTNFCAISFFTSALSSLCIAWSKTFVTMLLCAALQGIAIGCLLLVCLGLIPQYIKKEYQAFAMGCVNLYLLPFSIITPSLLGFFRDDLGSYTLLMYFLSLLASVKGILLILLPHIEAWRQSK